MERPIRKREERRNRPPRPGKARPDVEHPRRNERYTPITPQILDILWQMHEHLETWRDVSAVSGIKLRVIRRIQKGDYLTVSMTTMDKLITHTGVGQLNDYIWFTPDDLVALGIWRPINRPVE